MSKKLLCVNDEEIFLGPVEYFTVSGIDVETKIENDQYKIMEDEPVYLEGFDGAIRFNGADYPTFLGEETGYGTYRYRIRQTSVANPEKYEDLIIELKDQLLSWTNTWYDKVYWDGESNAYMYQDNVGFIRADGYDRSVFTSLSTSYTEIAVDGCPNSMDDYIAPYVSSNWGVAAWRTAVDNDWRAIIGHGFSSNMIICYMCLGSYRPEDQLLQIFKDTPLNAVFPRHNNVLSGSHQNRDSVPAEDVRVSTTTLTKKIKLKTFKGGTKYSVVNADGTLKGSVTISFACTESKYLPDPYVLSGETISTLFDDPDIVVDEDEYVYFNGFTGAHYIASSGGSMFNIKTLGERVNDKYCYTIRVMSADAMKIKYIPFYLDYQITGKGVGSVGGDITGHPVSRMYWNEDMNCYDLELTDKYLYIDHVDDTFEQWTWEAYNLSSEKRENMYFWGITDPDAITGHSGSSDKHAAFACSWITSAPDSAVYRDYVSSYKQVYTTKNSVGISAKGVTSMDVLNDRLSQTGPVHVIYRLAQPKIIHTNIYKKIKLPYFGPGTTYTMIKTHETGEEIRPSMEISVPLAYEFKIKNRTQSSTEINVDNDSLFRLAEGCSCYIKEINGAGQITNDTLQSVHEYEDGSYIYKINVTNTDGKIKQLTLKLPCMLLTGDKLYWDATRKEYMIAKITYYLKMDSAYDEEGNAIFFPLNIKYDQTTGWGFLVKNGYTDGIDANTYSRLSANRSILTLNNANVDYGGGTVFTLSQGISITPTLNQLLIDNDIIGYNDKRTNSTSSDGIVKLDEILHDEPLEVIYTLPNKYIEYIPTGIKKKIAIKITKDYFNGFTISMKNDIVKHTITATIPSICPDLTIPTPAYELQDTLVFTGSNYVDTNVKLFDKAKDFTTIVNFNTGAYTVLASNLTLFHCRNEASNYHGLAIKSRKIDDYSMTMDLLGNTKANSGKIVSSLSELDYQMGEYRFMIIYKQGMPHRVIKMGKNPSTGKLDPAYFTNIPILGNIPAFTAFNKTLWLGCNRTSSDGKNNYFKGTLLDCVVWTDVAFTDDMIDLYFNPVLPHTIYDQRDITCSNNMYTSISVDMFRRTRDFAVLIECTGAKNNYNGLVLSAGNGAISYSYSLFGLVYSPENNGYYFEYRPTSDAVLPPNILANDRYIKANSAGKISVIIMYKNGVPHRVINCTDSSNIEEIEVVSGLPTWTSGSISNTVFTVGNSLANERPWNGTINRCMIFDKGMLSDEDIEYITKYVCNR